MGTGCSQTLAIVNNAAMTTAAHKFSGIGVLGFFGYIFPAAELLFKVPRDSYSILDKHKTENAVLKCSQEGPRSDTILLRPAQGRSPGSRGDPDFTHSRTVHSLLGQGKLLLMA